MITDKELKKNGIKYPKAFRIGYNYAYYGETYAFGENTHKTDLKHVPNNVKDKEAWINDWHSGCGIGCEE